MTLLRPAIPVSRPETSADQQTPVEHDSLAADGGRTDIDAMERWLRDEVAPAFDAMIADPSRGISAEQVFADIHTRHAKRVEESR